MDEFLMYKYLNDKGINSRDEMDFMNKFKKFLRARKTYRRDNMPMDDDWQDYSEDDYRFFEKYRRGMRNSMGIDDDEEYYKMMKYMKESSSGNITESQAKHIVSQMYHVEKGRKYIGEKYDIHKAKEICERYKGIIPNDIKFLEVYVAINAQYHDYCELFKAWFGDNIDSKIIESAISFWFKDVDYPNGNKVMEYFNV